MNLSEVNVVTFAKVLNIDIQGELKRRFYDLGIIEGTDIEVLYRSPFKDPTAYKIRGTVIAIRKEDAEKIKVSI